MPLIYLGDGRPGSRDRAENYIWIESDQLREVLDKLGRHVDRLIVLPEPAEHELARRAGRIAIPEEN